MPAVPYSPVPSQTLQDIPTPEMNPRIPQAAFGGEVAMAKSGLGKAISGVGDEIFAVSLKMQDLNNRAEVDKADTEYMKQAGLLHAEFSAKQGLEAKQAFPKYMEDLQRAREAVKSTLSNPMSQRMFDSTSLGTMGRTIFNGAGHAASQLKAASVDAATQRLNTNVAIAGTTSDPAMIESARRTAIGLNHRLHELKGTPESTADSEFVINSSINANQISHIAETDPAKAEEMFAKLGPGKMTIEDYTRTQNKIKTYRHAIGSANITNDVLAAHMDAEGNLNVTVDQLQKEVKDRATKESPNDPLYPEIAVKTLQSKLNQDRYAKKQAKWDNVQILDQYIQNGASSLQELLADPKAKYAYEALPPSEQMKLPARIDNYIKARDRNSNEVTMTRLNGLKNNDVESFLNTDPTDPQLHLSQPQIRQVQEWQAKLKKSQAQDPRVDRAMSWMRSSFGSQMEAMGVYRRTKDNKDDYDKLTGAVQSAYDIWMENHQGKPPSNKEFNEQIAPELLKQHTNSGIFGTGWFAGKDPFFKQDTSTKEYTNFTDTIKADYTAKGLPEPTEQEIYKAYTRMQLMRLYPSGTKPK